MGTGTRGAGGERDRGGRWETGWGTKGLCCEETWPSGQSVCENKFCALSANIKFPLFDKWRIQPSPQKIHCNFKKIKQLGSNLVSDIAPFCLVFGMVYLVPFVFPPEYLFANAVGGVCNCYELCKTPSVCNRLKQLIYQSSQFNFNCFRWQKTTSRHLWLSDWQGKFNFHQHIKVMTK